MNSLYDLMMGHPMMRRPMLGQFPTQQPGGYDSSGINPHNMYGGTFGQPQMPRPFPANPGGFSLAHLFRQYR